MSRQFGGLQVIENLQLDVVKGEIVGILGPNGAGKSTLFNLISGVLVPDRGTVVYNGRDVTTLEVWHRRRLGIGHTHQIPKPFGHMTAFENVLVAAVHGTGLSIRQGRREADECLALTGLRKRSAVRAGQLTLLDLKRLELARAIAGRPSLLLLDEIAGGLTEAECHTLLDILRVLHSQGATIVWVEHVIHALIRLANRLAVLYSGSFLLRARPRKCSPTSASRTSTLANDRDHSGCSGLLATRGLSVYYDQFQAVREVDFSIDAGEIVALIGANGAGKSSFLKAIVGQVDRTEGAIEFCGQSLTSMSTPAISAAGIALVPEGRRLFPSLTVDENLRIGSSIGRRGPITLDQVYQWFPSIASRRHQLARSLSGGEQQMVALGRALLTTRVCFFATRLASG